MEPDTRLAAGIRAILESVQIQSATECLFAGYSMAMYTSGRDSQLAPASQAPSGGTATQIFPVVSGIQRRLYETFYCRNLDFNLNAAKSGGDKSEISSEFIEQLSCANFGRERWEDGWQVCQINAALLVYAQRYTERQLFSAGQYRSLAGGSVQIAPGSAIQAFMAKEARNEQPGFYCVLSETPLEEHDPTSFIRFYWNIDANGAAPLVATITEHMNRFQVAFRFKCLLDPSEYGRSDSAVLFVNKRLLSLVKQLLPRIYSAIKCNLKADIPLFTKCLAPGLGLGEDPGNGESFGMNRCRLLAEGLWKAFAEGVQSEEQRFEAVCHYLVEHGISLVHPYLRPGGIDQYVGIPVMLRESQGI